MNKVQRALSKIKNIVFDIRFTPVILLLLCLLSYGLFIPVTGFFMDDWYFMWFKHVFGALQFPAYYALDRPFQGFFYPVASMLLLGSESPVVWSLFAVILRWLSTFALWGMLKTFWPKAERQNRAVALLAAVFPGFTQHWVVIQFSYYYACLAFFFLSITLMLKALREPKKFWIYYPLSILLGFYSMASEFFFGLELVRPVILYIEFARQEKHFRKRVISVFKYWGAFLVYFIGFAIWRFFFFVSMNHAVAITNLLSGNVFNTIVSLGGRLVLWILTSVLYSWANPLMLSNYPDKGVISVLIPVIILFVFIGLFVWLMQFKERKAKVVEEEESSWRLEAFLVSIVSLVFAGIPFLVANLQVDYLGFENRFLLAFLFGSCLFITLIIDSIFLWTKEGKITTASRVMGLIACILLVSLSVGFQITNANFYKNIWIRQKEFFWQLNWRIPGLQPGTTLITYTFPSEAELYSGNTVTAQLNWTYASNVEDRKIDFQFIILDSNQRELLTSLEKDTPITVPFRTYTFHGNTSQSIYIDMPTQACLRILDQDVTPPESVIWKFDLVPYEPIRKSIIAATALTDLDLILNNDMGENHPPYQILGREISHTWCYYFEKAELARQFGDYGTILSLLSEATAKGYGPMVSTEWYPFIDAYARTGDWQNAEKVTTQISDKTDVALNLGLCHLWEKLSIDFVDPVSAGVSREMMENILQCDR